MDIDFQQKQSGNTLAGRVLERIIIGVKIVPYATLCMVIALLIVVTLLRLIVIVGGGTTPFTPNLYQQNYLIDLVFMICVEMYGNGAGIYTVPIQASLRMIQLVQLMASIAFCVEAALIIIRINYDQPIVFTIFFLMLVIIL